MKRIVVAAPTASTVNIVRNALVCRGLNQYIVEHAQSPQDTAARSNGAVLLILDWDDSDSVAAAHFHYGKNTPIVIFSSKMRQLDAERVTRGRSLGYIAKPADARNVVDVIQTALERVKFQEKIRLCSPNVEYINPFVAATIKAFKKMADMDVIRKKVYLMNTPNVNGDVSGIMGLSGQAKGNVAICLSAKLACSLFGRMVRCAPPPEPTGDVCDAVGEMINMISGQAKAALAAQNYRFSVSLPQIVTGRDHQVISQGGAPIVAILYEVEGMEFTVQVAIKEASTSFESSSVISEEAVVGDLALT